MESAITKQPTKLKPMIQQYAEAIEGFEDNDVVYRQLMKLRYKCMKKCSSPAAEIGIHIVEAQDGVEPLKCIKQKAKSFLNPNVITILIKEELKSRNIEVTDANDNFITSTDDKAYVNSLKRRYENTQLETTAATQSKKMEV